MARYIDLDRLLKGLEDELKDKNPDDLAYIVFKLFIGRLSTEPTADVVLKSEYDAVVSAVDNSTQEFLKLHDAYQNAKSEVERLQEAYNNRLAKDIQTNADFLKYAKAEAARKIFEELRQKRNELWNKGNYTMFECWCKAEEELRKKYLEV